MTYAELHCLSNFSFLRGASHPGELVARADELGYRAIAITDECSLAGIVRAWNEARERDIKLICGAEFYLEEGFHLVLLAPDRRAYAELCALISQARLHSAKGEYRLDLRQLRLGCQRCLAIWRADARQLVSEDCDSLLAQFSDRLWLGFSVHHQQRVEDHYLHLYDFAHQHRLPMVACGGVLMHERHRKPLQDVLTAIRLKSTVSKLGTQLLCNSEAFLKPIEELQQRYPLALLEESCRIADRCHFQLDELSYQYPEEALPQGQNPTSFLRRLTYDGARQRWPKGTPDKVREQIERELALIAELEYEHYFLTVHDIVQFARQQHILCQGRGSAANSAVCYCLFITEVDPERSQLLFERFISRERKERPDIDVDFEHERREEVIQYIYRKYGRRHAALSATVITYRLRSAIRDVGKAMGLDQDFINRLMENLAWWDKPKDLEQRLQSGSLDIGSRIARDFMTLVVTLMGFPRHLSQHVGGFVIAKEPIATLVPQENAAMAERTIIQWDKDDLESLGMMKIDILALGMLSALRKSLDYISDSLGAPFSLQDIPGRDPATYQMLSRADSIGVFQVESRAQMTMLPRLQPRHFYDLVIQIAIIRPGPIQGGMVHPFLRRRQGLEPVVYENDELKGVLERTLGIPIFQEQVIQLAMVAANFSGGEADQLRRAMASWGKNGNLLSFRDKLVDGMVANGYDAEFAERLFSQMKGFGAYGFPESHSASFALLAYASAWIKRHYPAEFFCGLLNSLPMGFYAPAQLIQDAKRHGVEIRAICINHSHWNHQLEYGASQPALRLGLRLAKGLQQDSAERLCAERQRGLFTSPEDFTARVPLNKAQRQCLIRADALHGFELHRYQSLWRVAAMDNTPSLTPPRQNPFDAIELPGPGEFEDIRHDYRYTGVSLRRHPMKVLRRHPAFGDCICAEQLPAQRDDSAVGIAGLVTCRQRPGTASGVLFLTLEDETGNTNVVVWADLQQRFRREILTGQLLKVRGQMQKTANPSPGAVPVIHVVARHISEYNALLEIDVASHDFH
ncbi:error-prone DNA polymerase [Spongiibacter nanhainus]|uniref:Error-prone DNA polymerase n=1 Tax=Spongiibacter nanhainus TaxID=2794344 RepID=A0A7T4QYP1_9GAMM|nr:error-prone DNA polymerase [Spongiibacter nanhainus]QQD17072.1 error-prone DNA polymerase [Spongiibacter nanhainus]